MEIISPFILSLTVFILAVFVGYYVVWKEYTQESDHARCEGERLDLEGHYSSIVELEDTPCENHCGERREILSRLLVCTLIFFANFIVRSSLLMLRTHVRMSTRQDPYRRWNVLDRGGGSTSNGFSNLCDLHIERSIVKSCPQGM